MVGVVLLQEPDDDTAFLLAELMQAELACEVLRTVTEAETLALLDERVWCVLVADHPFRRDRDLLTSLHARGWEQRLCLLGSSRVSSERALAHGCFHLMKPFDISIFLRMVRKIFSLTAA